MQRLTLRKLRDRIDRYIDEFGDMPLEMDDILLVKVDNGQSIMLVSPNEVPNEQRKDRLEEHGFEFEEHSYFVVLTDLLYAYNEDNEGYDSQVNYCHNKLKQKYP